MAFRPARLHPHFPFGGLLPRPPPDFPPVVLGPFVGRPLSLCLVMLFGPRAAHVPRTRCNRPANITRPQGDNLSTRLWNAEGVGKSAPATPVIEEAARLVAYWNDLQSVQPHELRAHLALDRMCKAVYESLHTESDWHLTTSFWVPVREEKLLVTILVGRVGRDVRAVMREGNPDDIPRYYPASKLRADLEDNKVGILASWELWINAYFLNGIRDALFGVSSSGAGAAWHALEAYPQAEAARTAFAALRDAHPHIPAFSGRERGLLRQRPSVLGRQTSSRSALVWKRARQLDVRIPPQNVPLDKLRGRNPPEGMARKGNALTLTEKLVDYLRHDLGMSRVATADALEMEDWRQVRDAEDQVEKKRGRWADFKRARRH